MSEPAPFPQEGETMIAHCDDCNVKTTWTVIKIDDTYYWECSRCHKMVTIGRWPEDKK
jgi:uncharacterized paraquat-inducible protein A